MFLLFSVHSVFTQPTGEPLNGFDEMNRFAKSQLSRVLEFIPVDEEGKYGFKSRAEFKIAALGIPYQEYSLDLDKPTGYWRIPVTVNNENRALMTIKKQNGQWMFSHFGAARLATELSFFEKHRANSVPAWGRIVRDFEMSCDYLQFDPQNQTKLGGLIHPMESAARIMLRSQGSIDTQGYTIPQVREFRFKMMSLSMDESREDPETGKVK